MLLQDILLMAVICSFNFAPCTSFLKFILLGLICNFSCKLLECDFSEEREAEMWNCRSHVVNHGHE